MSYPAHHIAVGICITAAGYHAAGPIGAIIAAPLAFASHYPLDWLNERSYGPLWSREWFKWDALPILAIAVAAWLSGVWWVFALGGIAGAGMDIIDKTASKIRTGDWFAEPGVFHRNNPPKVNMTAIQTKALAVVAGVVPFALAAL